MSPAGRPAVLKSPNPLLFADPGLFQRFRRETDIVNQIEFADQPHHLLNVERAAASPYPEHCGLLLHSVFERSGYRFA